MTRKRFKLTAYHVALIEGMYASGLGIDPKRPFGNGDVIEDVIRLTKPMSEESARQLLEEVGTALQIFLRCAEVQRGTYTCSEYGTDWKLEES